jgi:tetratricopeptide (TPR) repeat protein
MLGRLEDAHEAARIAEANANGVESTIQYRIADALVSSALGEHAQAAATARAAVELSEMMDEPLIRGDAALTLGEVLQAEGRRAEAAAAFEAALAGYERKGILPAVARTRALLHEVTAPAR